MALIDTGVAPVPGLTSGNVVNGPDLSFDSQQPGMAHLDAFGHGTHMASIIAGRDAAGTPSSYLDPARFTGIAPDATLVNVKVGASNGAVDVTQVIAAIDWVVEHRKDPGLNIRVINLSYGTDSVQSSTVDPLAFAVENAVEEGHRRRRRRRQRRPSRPRRWPTRPTTRTSSRSARWTAPAR